MIKANFIYSALEQVNITRESCEDLSKDFTNAMQMLFNKSVDDVLSKSEFINAIYGRDIVSVAFNNDSVIAFKVDYTEEEKDLTLLFKFARPNLRLNDTIEDFKITILKNIAKHDFDFQYIMQENIDNVLDYIYNYGKER